MRSLAHDELLMMDFLSDEISPEEFTRRFIKPRIPVLISSDLTSKWPALKLWRKSQQSQFTPNWEHLNATYGQSIVPVHDCSAQTCSVLLLSEFIQNMQNTDLTLYAKDWHLMRDHHCDNQLDQQPYTVPEYFSNDMLNAYWMSQKAPTNDDYRFVYIGKKDSFTLLHADVFRSNSWSTNVCGVKEWTLFPPDQEHLLKDKLGNYISDIREVDEKRFPKFKQTVPITVIQRSGETIFVPSGWYHQVRNLDDTISINHNWITVNELRSCIEFHMQQLEDCQRQLLDLKEPPVSMNDNEWNIECQKLLRAHSGMDSSQWRQLVLEHKDTKDSRIIEECLNILS